jgi:hypothetical protein
MRSSIAEPSVESGWNVRERHEATVERRCGFGPQHAHRSQILIGAGTTLGERHAQRVQFRLDVPDSDSHGLASVVVVAERVVARNR